MTIINPLPYNIANGQAVDAVPVMADFNQIVSNVNANAAPASGSPNYAPASGSPNYATITGSTNYAPDTGSTANAYVVDLTPAIPATVPDGFPVNMYVTPARVNTGAATLNGVAIIDRNGNPVYGGQIKGMCALQYSTAYAKWMFTGAKETLSVLDFGADPTGATDSTAAIQNALNAAAASNIGKVTAPGLFRLSNQVVVPEKVALIGNNTSCGVNSAFAVGNYVPNPLSYPTVFVSDATLSGPVFLLQTSSSIQWAVIIVSGFVSTASTNWGYTTTPTYTGTAIGTLASASQPMSDTFVHGCQIYGYQYGVQLPYVARAIVDLCSFECLNCVEITYSFDISQIRNCHAYPACAGSSSSQSARIKNGAAYTLAQNQGSDHIIENCFSYGWNTFATLTNEGGDRVINCLADGPGGFSQVGISISGTCYGTNQISNFQATVAIGLESSSPSNYGVPVAQVSNSWFTGNTSFNISGGGIFYVSQDVSLNNTSTIVDNISSIIFSQKRRSYPTINQNYLPNSSFLYGLAGWNAPSGASIGNYAPFTYIQFPGTGTQETATSDPIYAQGLVAPPGTYICLSAMCTNVSASAPSTIGINFYNSSGTLISSSTQSAPVGSFLSLQKIHTTSPSGASYVTVSLSAIGPSGANMVFSQIKLEVSRYATEWTDESSAQILNVLIPQAPTGVTVGASPFAYTAPTSGTVCASGGAITSVALARNGTTVYTSALAADSVPVAKGDVVTITYTAAPTVYFLGN